MTLISALGFVLLIAGQFQERRPVIKLALLVDRQFGSVALMGVVIGMMMYGSAYMIPQFLSAIAGYDALQSGEIVLLSGIPSLILMPFTPFLIRNVDIRVAVSCGLMAMMGSCLIDTVLTADAVGHDFVHSQLLRGVGAIFAFLFLNQAAIGSVPARDAGDAAGLFSACRNIGGSLALAGIATIQDQRSWFHSRRLEESLNANSVRLQDYMANLSLSGGPDVAMRKLAATIQREALVMTYNDLFWILAMTILAVTPLVLFLRPLQNKTPVAMH